MPPPPWRARLAVATVFFANGAGFASLVPHIPSVQSSLDLRPSVLGFALLAMAAGALCGIPLSGVCTSRFGSRAVVHVTAAAFFAALPLPIAATSLVLLVPALFVLGASNGALDVSMNTQAVGVEAQWPTPILSSFHGLWSLGGLVGAGIAALTLYAGIAPLTHVIGATIVFGASALVACRSLLPRAADPHDEGPRFVRPTRALATLGLIALLALMSEGAMGDWSAVYIRNTLGADAATAALGFAAFAGAMAAGRFLGDAIVARFGDARVVRWATTMAAVGFGAALLVGTPRAAIIGCAVVGLGLSNLVPIVFRTASHVPGVPASHGIAAVGTTGYAGFLAGPPLIGLAAEGVTLAGALWIIVAALAWIALLTRDLPRR